MKNLINSGKMLTCILPKGEGQPLLEKLYEKGYTRVMVYSARGVQMNGEVKRLSVPIEKDLLKVICKEEEASEVFEFIYFETQMDSKHGAFVYQSSIAGNTQFVLPDLPEAG